MEKWRQESCYKYCANDSGEKAVTNILLDVQVVISMTLVFASLEGAEQRRALVVADVLRI